MSDGIKILLDCVERFIVATARFVEAHFDKLLLSLIFFWVANRGMGSDDVPGVSWAREQASAILGALIGLITGVKIGMEIQKRRSATEEAATTTTTTTTTEDR